MDDAQASRPRWPVWLTCASLVVGVLLMYGVLFGPKYYVHSLDGLQLVIVELMAAAALAVCALLGIVMLIAKRTHRSFGSYAAVVFALLVCGLIFVPTGLLTTVPLATKLPSAETLTTPPKVPTK